jgi:hypothetical protein
MSLAVHTRTIFFIPSAKNLLILLQSYNNFVLCAQSERLFSDSRHPGGEFLTLSKAKHDAWRFVYSFDFLLQAADYILRKAG